MKTTILTDIEGTTSSISFVKDVLFPHARRELPRFVREHGQQREVRQWLDQVAAEHGGSCSDESVVQALQGMIDQDVKHTALKALQGMIWQQGYGDGQFTAHIYPDVLPALQAWHAAGHGLAVFSSGSVAAQKLLFGHTTAGDLRPLFQGFFDTGIGHKRVADSYRLIADRMDRSPGDVLFLSDIVEELDAAREAGMQTRLLDRREDYPEPRAGDEATHGHARVDTFAEITP